jgi:hypothetical protein
MAPYGESPFEVPLTVEETLGIERVGNAVNSGVPLPEGAVKDTAELRLFDAKGNTVLASIEPRARWLSDASLKWVTVHFLADLPANGSARYTLARSDAAVPPPELKIRRDDRAITVVTGPGRFVVPTDRFAPFDQIYVRTDPAKPFAEGDGLLAKASRVILVGRNGESRVVPRTGEHADEFRTERVRIDEAAFTQTPSVETVEIEEEGPGRAVVALKGTFSSPEAASLDFTARLYFFSGSPAVEMTFSVLNRQNEGMAHFVAIDRLTLELPLKTEGETGVSFGMDGKTVEHPLTHEEVGFSQTDWNWCGLNGISAGEKSEGWMRVASKAGILTAGTRWSWQVYPMGAKARPDGTLALALKSEDGEPVDLYTAGAKTHFLFLHAARGEAPAPRAIASGTSEPLFAVCDPNWYCQETRVFGDLYANNPALFQPEYRDVIARYQDRIDACLESIVAKRPRPDWHVHEFGWLNFGSGLHHHTCLRENDHESWWDSNYYDFPHAVIVNFLRTGIRLNLTTAVEAGLHLADLDICHCFPGNPDNIGSPRSGPVVGHFRNYTRGQEFMGHSSFTFYKNESLYELYYLTGERWFHEAGRMSSDFAMTHWGRGALRNVAHGIWGVLSAYQDTHAQRYLDRARFFVDEWAKPWQDEFDGSFNDQLWMYGLQFEAYDKYYRITGDVETAAYCLKAVKAVISEEVGDGQWRKGGAGSGICLAGYGYAYDYTGDGAYLDYGLKVLEATTCAEGERVKTFAQQFRASPYFLKVLTLGYTPGAELDSA